MRFGRLRDARVRAAAFEWLAGQVDLHGDEVPLSITTSPNSPYDDHSSSSGPDVNL